MGLYSDFIFPKYYDSVLNHIVSDKTRTEFLSSARGKILEIGIGTGLNLDFYPKNISHITAIDPSPGMVKKLRAKSEKKSIKVEFIQTGAEQLPFPDQKFDTVVSALTFCTIPERQRALSEIKRVLAPGGKFIFLEHGLSPNSLVAKTQKILNPLQNLIGCGCRLNVDIETELLQAGYTIERLNKYYLEGSPKFIGHIYEGVASATRD